MKVTMEDCQMIEKVTLNGKDVTNQCFEADDEAGYVKIYLHKNGRPYLNKRKTEIVYRTKRGRVEIFPRDRKNSPQIKSQR